MISSSQDILLKAKEVRRVTWWGLAANLVLSGLKFLLGTLGACQALVADAVHSLSDTVTDFTVLFGSAIWSRPPDENHPHGHGRIEMLVSLTIGIVLGGVGIGLGYKAIATMNVPETSPPGLIALVGALLSIGVKEWLYRWTVAVGRKVRSSAVLANAWHHRSDALSSIPVAVAVIGTRIWPSMTLLDHVAAVIVSVMVLVAAWQIAWPSLVLLVDAGADERACLHMMELARAVPGVTGVHHLRTRHIGPGLQIDLHIQVDPGITVLQGHNISHMVKDALLRDAPLVVDVLVHLEPEGCPYRGPEPPPEG